MDIELQRNIFSELKQLLKIQLKACDSSVPNKINLEMHVI